MGGLDPADGRQHRPGDPVACALGAVQPQIPGGDVGPCSPARAGLPGDRLLGGRGRLGRRLEQAQVLRNAGCPVRVIGRHPEKMRLCDQWGIRSRAVADISPRHDQEVVVDCTGSASGLEMAMQLVRPRGTIVLKSTVADGKALNLAPIVIDEINVVGSRCGPFKEAIKALTEKSVDVTSMIHRRMKLEQGVEAMEMAAKPGALKVILKNQREA